ncbi:uncharacterized protein LOC133744219 [Rosa rugosa]|uniref:uncharacterized protein LOC133744219 n=1 Tax=Rosa rugosa TaxID=74645 RepID=UPI002B404264|nr:uncharacterized protein LOC133744219 [Rosa rugosa]
MEMGFSELPIRAEREAEKEKRRKYEDHYKVLGLPSDEEGSKLIEKQITKAYHAKALVLHLDKRPKSDLQANTNFQRLKRSYEVFKNESSRIVFDKMHRDQRQKDGRHLERDPKQQKMVSDLETRERSAKFDWDAKKRETGEVGKKVNGGVGISLRLEEEKVIRVCWEKFGGEGYTAKRLRDLLSKFGGVKDLILGSVAPKRTVALTAEKSDEPDTVNNLLGVGFRTFEDDVLKKVAKAGQK